MVTNLLIHNFLLSGIMYLRKEMNNQEDEGLFLLCESSFKFCSI